MDGRLVAIPRFGVSPTANLDHAVAADHPIVWTGGN
jgi:hypothetical protein